MGRKPDDGRRLPDWDQVIAAAARLQKLVPDTVLVGGSAASHHVGHRVSFDDDHVLVDLRERFDDVLEALEASDGWVTARVKRPVLILGRLDGVETGIRQLIRRRPLDVEEVEVGDDGGKLHVPTLPETLRIKAWLVLVRNATRDYLDLVALADRLGDGAPDVLFELDDYYEDQVGAGGRRVATQLVKQLADPAPYDLDEVDLAHYRRLVPRWQDWAQVAQDCRALASSVLDRLGRRTVIHRHLDYAGTPILERGRAAIDDVLDNGDLDDWAPLAEAIAADPHGAPATTVLELCQAHPMYGTSALWDDWIRRLRRRRAQADATRPEPEPLSLAGLRLRRGLRQADVAAHMGASQPDVSKIEARRDLRLSTLRAYVAATGGRLECRAVYPEEGVNLSHGRGESESPAAECSGG